MDSFLARRMELEPVSSCSSVFSVTEPRDRRVGVNALDRLVMDRRRAISSFMAKGLVR